MNVLVNRRSNWCVRWSYCSPARSPGLPRLDCLHEDLEFILFDLETALDFSYPDEPYYQRLALIYHTDNVDLRVHAYRDKVYRLIDCFLGTNENLKEKRIGDFHDKVRTALGDRGLKRAVAGPPPGLTGEAALLRRRPPPRRWR